MKIHTIPVGDLQANCYIIENLQDKQAILIDPGAEANKIINFIKKNELKVVAILLTHGHADHISALDKVREACLAKVYIHADDAPMLTNAKQNLSSFIGADRIFKEAEENLADGQLLNIAGLEIQVLTIPGHTKGGCSFKIGEHVFVGDSIFLESIGRTDLPGGSYKSLISNLKTKILTLPENTKLYPGHGPSTDVAWEKRMNPFLQ
ncbi:MBL fold metallo-hydrolase [Succinispira mobilis]|uniref:MBL fold metallo-hydrolase n=1 Tax=Succinispira mobilis TaxID=78120 RepID=UPI00036A93C8|nr:MBL fold metallo-hydrolase [Succinispira mobilis]